LRGFIATKTRSYFATEDKENSIIFSHRYLGHKFHGLRGFLELTGIVSLGSVWFESGASRGQVKKYKSFSSKEKQIWAIRGKKIKAKENTRKGPA